MWVALLFGAIVGTSLGVFGGGGSALAVPLLAYGLGLDAREAVTTSLIVVGLAALAGAARHWRQGTVDGLVAMVFGVLGFVGSAVGAQGARHLSPSIQMTLFALTLIIAATLMLIHDPAPASDTDSFRISLRTVLAAAGAGLLTGVVGVGGGFILVPTLVSVARIPMHRAVGTSLVVIALNALGGVASYASYVTVSATVWAPFALGAIVAAVGGAMLGRQIGEMRLRSAFAVGLILIGIFTIAKESLL